MKNLIDESIRSKTSVDENIGEMLVGIQLQKQEIEKIIRHYSRQQEPVMSSGQKVGNSGKEVKNVI
jgi:hypothetical protein